VQENNKTLIIRAEGNFDGEFSKQLELREAKELSKLQGEDDES
jgi:hypothetical protein